MSSWGEETPTNYEEDTTTYYEEETPADSTAVLLFGIVGLTNTAIALGLYFAVYIESQGGLFDLNYWYTAGWSSYVALVPSLWGLVAAAWLYDNIVSNEGSGGLMKIALYVSYAAAFATVVPGILLWLSLATDEGFDYFIDVATWAAVLTIQGVASIVFVFLYVNEAMRYLDERVAVEDEVWTVEEEPVPTNDESWDEWKVAF